MWGNDSACVVGGFETVPYDYAEYDDIYMRSKMEGGQAHGD